MKKPTKKPHILTESCSQLDLYVEYTSDDFRNLSTYMDDQDIKTIEIEIDGEGGVVQRRMESELEAEVRYAKEFKKWEKWKAAEEVRKSRRRERLIKEAKKLGIEFNIKIKNICFKI